jgi:uncharacterized phage protein (TIGR01671 family)
MREIKFRAWYKSVERMEDIEIMQYTDIEDKNSKEIYEGDIINQTTATGTDGHIEQVIFLLGIFGTQSKGRGFNNLNNWTNEVIGNIYENPELVNERNSN